MPFFVPGISTLVSCAQLEQLEQLVDLPSEDQERVRRAARVLQQRLILKQWLTHHNLAQHYQRSVFFFLYCLHLLV
jgi:apoptosis-resistant E3 ubiquitin protein ligase 1